MASTDISIFHEISVHGTSYHEWDDLLKKLSVIIDRATTQDEKESAVGNIIYALRQDYLNGHKRLNRKHHLDLLITMFRKCSLKLSEIEKALMDVEDDEQHNLAPKMYARFTGMLIEKILDIPERPRQPHYHSKD